MDICKQGIALFITLMVIASIMSIIAVSFSYLEKVQKDAGETSAMIQAGLIYKNTNNILKRFFPKKKDNSKKLELIYTMPLVLSEEESGFNINLNCEPLFKGVPINWLNEKSKPKSTLAKNILVEVFERYEVEEANELEALILQAIKGRKTSNDDYVPRIIAHKGIVSQQQFERIITEYQLLYDDPLVRRIPWTDYFSFSPISKNTKIDGVYLTPELISIAFEIPIEIVQDSWITGESKLRSFLQENSITSPVDKNIYSNTALNAMHCEESYAYRDGVYKFNFDYIEGRSGNFEFNGKE